MTLKGKIPILYGASPIPRDLTLYEQKHDKTRAVSKKTLPHASVTSSGAQVASQQSLILQTGNKK